MNGFTDPGEHPPPNTPRSQRGVFCYVTRTAVHENTQYSRVLGGVTNGVGTLPSNAHVHTENTSDPGRVNIYYYELYWIGSATRNPDGATWTVLIRDTEYVVEGLSHVADKARDVWNSLPVR